MSLARNLAVLSAFLMVSCAAPKVVQDSCRDSLVIRVKDSLILRDSVVLIQIPTETAMAILPDTDTSRLETGVASSEAFVSNGRLYHTLTNKDALLPVSITIPMRVYTEHREKAMILRQTIEVEKELSRWQNFIQLLGYGVLILVVLWLLNKVRKFVI